jgi:hypothetical protein
MRSKATVLAALFNEATDNQVSTFEERYGVDTLRTCGCSIDGDGSRRVSEKSLP